MGIPSLLALLGCSESVFTTDFRAELARLKLPTLIIHGDPDVSAPVEITGARTAELMPTAEFRLYEDAPHALVVTHLRQFEADLVDFMVRQRLPPDGDPRRGKLAEHRATAGRRRGGRHDVTELGVVGVQALGQRRARLAGQVGGRGPSPRAASRLASRSSRSRPRQARIVNGSSSKPSARR